MASKAEVLKNKITKAIQNEDSSIVMNFVLISVVKKGSFLSSSLEVQRSGRVEKESDLEKIKQIARQTAGDTPVVSNLCFKGRCLYRAAVRA